jgi:hypothetical protein
MMLRDSKRRATSQFRATARSPRPAGGGAALGAPRVQGLPPATTGPASRLGTTGAARFLPSAAIHA